MCHFQVHPNLLQTALTKLAGLSYGNLSIYENIRAKHRVRFILSRSITNGDTAPLSDALRRRYFSRSRLFASWFAFRFVDSLLSDNRRDWSHRKGLRPKVSKMGLFKGLWKVVHGELSTPLPSAICGTGKGLSNVPSGLLSPTDGSCWEWVYRSLTR